MKYWPGGIHRFSKDGRIVLIDWFGNIDLIGMFKATSKEELIKFCVYRCEKIERILKEQALETGKPVIFFIFF